MSFLDGHEEGCTPLKTCCNCRAVAFLRERLNHTGFAEFLGILGLQDSAPQIERVPLETRLTREMFAKAAPYHVLINHNIVTVGDLVRQTERTLRGRLPMFGDVALRHTKDALAKLGYSLGELPFEPHAVAS